MSTTTENTQLINLFTNFIKDASNLVRVQKDTNCLISQIIAHMVSDECNETAIKNLERIFQRPFTVDDTVQEGEEDLQVEKKPKGKKSKVTPVEDEPIIELVAPVVASVCTTPVLEEPKPKVKNVKTKKSKEESKDKKIKSKVAKVKKTKAEPKQEPKEELKEDTPKEKTDLVAKLVIMTNTEDTEELTEEDLLELISEDED